jgi:hypothetical protein
MRRFVSTAGILGLLLVVLGVAGTVHEAAAANPHIRFVDNGDGTITDNQTGLMWEKKLAADDVGGNCSDADQANRSPRCVNNTYRWSVTGTGPDGPLFTEFLAKMTCSVSADGTCSLALAGFTDWRIPTIAELQTILAPCPGGGVPCIDPIFGPTTAFDYWLLSASTNVSNAAWRVSFFGGTTADLQNTFNLSARAVRGGP